MSPREDAGRRISAVRISYKEVERQISRCVLAGRMELPLHARIDARADARAAVLAHEEALAALKAVLDIAEPVQRVLDVVAVEVPVE